ncbi:MAG TPA: DUF2585 family protein [Micropepsaceae bacterium]|nr:DUF2585 family protein [Micropepsaceae bacterium]
MRQTDSSLRIALFAAFMMVLLQAAVLFFFGQPPICTCGYVKLWEGAVLSSGNSQHLTDWYTFSHIIHGMLFYAFTWAAFPRLPIGYRFLIALGVEGAWEITENTPWIIGRYREQALAQGYSGDSIVNSVMDSLSMAFGFVLARRLPLWSTVALAVGMEVVVAYFIRDNLTLNVLNLLYPLDFVHRWQSAGA